MDKKLGSRNSSRHDHCRELRTGAKVCDTLLEFRTVAEGIKKEWRSEAIKTEWRSEISKAASI